MKIFCSYPVGSLPGNSDCKLNSWLRCYIEEFRANHEGPCEIQLIADNDSNEITIDPGQLRQILTNLCSNGLRYSLQATGTASLTLHVHLNPISQVAELDIIDDGPGVKPEHEAHLFEPFFTTDTQGTGLGLYISRELCEANQARLNYTRTGLG